jgi:hypothetical protein
MGGGGRATSARARASDGKGKIRRGCRLLAQSNRSAFPIRWMRSQTALSRSRRPAPPAPPRVRLNLVVSAVITDLDDLSKAGFETYEIVGA